MTIKKIIDGLYFTVGMMLFNPATGKSKTPDELNEDDRYTYDACMGAIELLKAQEPRTVLYIFKSHEGTFGNCPTCDAELMNYYNETQCGRCGQAVKWE